jgi:UDP-N-acetylmuramoyl-tripeptide--D-alanyl-D-alanine ligase
MIPLELELVEPLGRLQARPWATEIAGVQIDSRRIEEGDLFVAVGDGADFAAHALARGAAAVLVPAHAHEALAALGRAVRERSAAQVVAITGATGKTTTKDILFALCSPHLRTIASEANFNNELGVPLTLCRIEPDTELAIVEMGMRGLGQIAWLTSFTQPDVALITNVGPVHLELVGTVEKVAEAKAEIVAGLRPGGIAIIPDEPLLEPYLTRDDVEIRRFPSLDDVEPFPFETSYSARHQLQNTLAALTVSEVLGVQAPARLEVAFTALREEELELPGGTLLLNDCYNANPMSMRAALTHLVERANGRRPLAVLGEMAELGEGAVAYHREIGALARDLGVEVIGVGRLGSEYGGRSVATAEDAAAALEGEVGPGDVVLVKGSRSVGLEAIAAKLTA